MQRWLGRFAILWLAFVVPSLVIWGLIVRWNNHGPKHLVSTSMWLADHLWFPLLFHPLTVPAGHWLTDGSGFRAASGFILLILVWCVVFALPLSLILIWAEWFGRRLTPDRTSQSSIYDYDATMPISGGSSPAINALYVITLPVALIWMVLRSLLKPMLITFIGVFILRFLYTYLTLLLSDAHGFARRFGKLYEAWNGYLGRLGMHRLFAGQWQAWYPPTRKLSGQMSTNPSLFHSFYDHPEHYRYVVKLLALDAGMYALIAAVIVGCFCVLLDLLHVLGVTA